MFTDEQLQLLKNGGSDARLALSGTGLRDLVARLEAAEEFIRLGSQEQSVNSIELRNAEEEWRKACGRE